MGKMINPRITRGTVHGSCPRCGEPYLGEMDADEQDVLLKCVGCGHEGRYFYSWPDELPPVVLRRKSNGQKLKLRGLGKKISQHTEPNKYTELDKINQLTLFD